MKKWSFVLVLLVGATILGATVLREPIAHAAATVNATIVGPLDNGNVKVHEQGTAKVSEQNVDANGNVKVHEQGTADVNVTNSSLSIAPAAPITSGGFSSSLSTGVSCHPLGVDEIATALSIKLSSGVESVLLGNGGGSCSGFAALFAGPATGGNDSIVLTLARPIKFNEIGCIGASGFCSVSWVGGSP
jgi:hypothetical protein